MKEKAVKNNLYLPCGSCGSDVHSRSSACKKCGAPSPWSEKRGDSAVKATVKPSVQTVKIEAPKNYIVLKDFSSIVDNVMVTLKAKKVVTDQMLITKLLAANAPIVPVGTEDAICVCPACKHTFLKETSGSTAAR